MRFIDHEDIMAHWNKTKRRSDSIRVASRLRLRKRGDTFTACAPDGTELFTITPDNVVRFVHLGSGPVYDTVAAIRAAFHPCVLDTYVGQRGVRMLYIHSTRARAAITPGLTVNLKTGAVDNVVSHKLKDRRNPQKMREWNALYKPWLQRLRFLARCGVFIGHRRQMIQVGDANTYSGLYLVDLPDRPSDSVALGHSYWDLRAAAVVHASVVSGELDDMTLRRLTHAFSLGLEGRDDIKDIDNHLGSKVGFLARALYGVYTWEKE